MYMNPILLLLILFGARMNTAYNPNLLFKKYVTIHNTTIAKILISQSDVTTRAKNKKSDRNKLLLSGIVFYSLEGLLIILALFLIFFAPPISIEYFEIDTRYLFLSASTLNEKIIITLSTLLLTTEIIFYFINTIKCHLNKAKSSKAIIGIYIFLIAVLLIGEIYFATQFFSCFL